MERTLDVMEAELKSVNEKLEPLQTKKINLEREIKKYKLGNALYYPMSELLNYKGREIRSITLVEKGKNGKLTTNYMWNDEIFNVTDDGHLHYSSYEGGIMDYDSNTGKYVSWYHYFKNEHDYVGFLEIELEDED